MEKVLDISEFLYMLKKNWWVIILITLITTGLGFNNARKMVPAYRGSMKIFLGSSSGGEDMMNMYSQEELSQYSEFLSIFKEIIGIQEFMESTLKRHDLNMSAGAVSAGLNISGSSKTPIYTLSYGSGNEAIIEPVLMAVYDELSVQVDRLIPGKKITILNNVSTYPIMPNKAKRILTGFGMGFMGSIMLLFIKYYMDNTIKTREQLEKVLPIPVLGEIPSHERKFVKEEKRYASCQKDAKVYISGGVQDFKNEA